MDETSKTSDIIKNQHYVPVFYLRRFVNEKNEVEILDCKARKLVLPRGPKGICSDDFFYGARTGQPDALSQNVEKQFQALEDFLAKEIDCLIGKLRSDAQITDQEKWVIGLMMSMMWIRGPKMRNQVNSLSDQVFKHVNAFQFGSKYADGIFDRFDKDTGQTTAPDLREKIKETVVNREYSVEFNNVQHLMMFETIQNFANLFTGQHWIVYISKMPQKFITSDNPVAVSIPKSKGFYGPTFLERTHYFALTPEICIKATWPESHHGKKLRRKTLFKGQERQILDLNAHIASDAHQYAYSRDKQPLAELLSLIQRQEAFFATPGGKLIKKKLDDLR